MDGIEGNLEEDVSSLLVFVLGLRGSGVDSTKFTISHVPWPHSNR